MFGIFKRKVIEKEIERIQIISVKENDVLLLTCNCKLTERTYERMKEQFKTHLPNIKIVILEDGIRADIISPVD